MTGSESWMVMELSFWERYQISHIDSYYIVILIFSLQTCGTNKPAAAIKSKTNQARIEFHSDTSVNDKVSGFCDIEYIFKLPNILREVKATVPVAGGWGTWGAWSSCANNQ